MTRLIFLFLFLIGCGKEEVNNYYYSVYPDYYNNFAPEVREYVMQFEQDSAFFGVPKSASGVTIKVIDGEIVGRDPDKKVSSQTVGVCYKYNDGRRDIELESEFLNSRDEITRKALVYHELGHCVMDKAHNNKTFQSTCGETYPIMNSYIPPFNYLSRCWQGMLQNFFTESAAGLHEDDCYETNFGQQCYIVNESHYSLAEIIWGIITWAFFAVAFMVLFAVVLWILFE